MHCLYFLFVHLLFEIALFLHFNESSAASKLKSKYKTLMFGGSTTRMFTAVLILIISVYSYLLVHVRNQGGRRNANHNAEPGGPGATPKSASYGEQAVPLSVHTYLRYVIVHPVIPITPADLRSLTVEQLLKVELNERKHVQLLLGVLYRRGGTVRQTQETGIEKLAKIICEEISEQLVRELKAMLTQ